MVKVVTKMVQEDYHDEIDLQIQVPTIFRGKSADLINNTVFIKQFSRNKTEVPQSPIKQKTIISTKSNKKENLTRSQFYKQIQ